MNAADNSVWFGLPADWDSGFCLFRLKADEDDSYGWCEVTRVRHYAEGDPTFNLIDYVVSNALLAADGWNAVDPPEEVPG